MSENLAYLFQDYYCSLSNKNYSVDTVDRVFGGASRETYKIKLSDDSGNIEIGPKTFPGQFFDRNRTKDRIPSLFCISKLSSSCTRADRYG